MNRTEVEVADLTTTEIVAVYNSINPEKPVKKFQDRATAERRLSQLLSEERMRVERGTDGAVAAYDDDPGEFAGDEQPTEPRVGAEPAPTTVSPGLARLRAHPKAEVIRQETVAAQQAARAAVHAPTTPAPAPAAVPAPAPRRRGGPAAKHSDDATIVVLVTKNPKREGTACHGRFALYVPGMTVADYLVAGGTRADLRWDESQGFIRIG